MVNACGLVELHFYRSLPEMLGALEKSAFAAFGRFSVARLAFAMLLMLGLEMGPFAALLIGDADARVLGGIALALLMAVQLTVCRWLRRPLAPGLLAPVGMLILWYGVVRATILTLRRGGIVWRGTFYPLAALKRGARFEII